MVTVKVKVNKKVRSQTVAFEGESITKIISLQNCRWVWKKTLKKHVALDRSSWSLERVCILFSLKCIWLERCCKSRIHVQ